MRRLQLKSKQLTWQSVIFCGGHEWTCQEWICKEYPDLRCRVHKKGKAEFHQFMLSGDHGTRHASLKDAYRALMNRKAIRIGHVKKTKPRRVTTKHSRARR